MRADLLDVDKTFSADETKALWALLASGFTATVTLTGFLITRAHNLRLLAAQEAAESQQAIVQEETERRLVLDTAVKGVSLLGAGDGKYAPRAAVAGALATLVHLGHPVIAMRCLAAAWADKAIDTASATGLIDEGLASDDGGSQLEANLLMTNAGQLVTDDRPGDLHWPCDGWKSGAGIFAWMRA
ncbi:hypothetical protein [Geodermatophilus sp. URMC 65]